MSDIVYVKAADEQARQDRHGNRVQDYAAGKLARAYVTIKRYKPKAKIYHEVNVNGRDCYFSEVAHDILAAVLVELEADRDLHTSTIANMTGASRGYVSKVISLLYRLGFITILERIRGRWGRIVASIVNVSSLPRRYVYREETLKSARLGSDFEAYVATLKDGDIYVPASMRAMLYG